MTAMHSLRRMARTAAGLIRSGDFAGIAQLSAVRSRKLGYRLESWLLRLPKSPVEIDARFQRFGPDGSVLAKAATFCFPETAPLLASVVIPCFNYGRFLVEAVDSVRAQTLDKVEIIVVDDGSTDELTKSVLAGLERDDSLTVLRQENGGLVSARNAGIALAGGEYVCCLDSDDRLMPNYLEAAILAMESDRAIGFAYSWVHLFGDEAGIWQTRDFDIEEALENNHTAVCAVFRRDDWVAAGGYEPRMREGYEDWEFWLRIAALGRKGKLVPAPYFEHRRHGRTMTHDAHDARPGLKRRMRGLNPGVFGNARLRNRIANVQAPDDGAGLHLPTVVPGRGDRPHVMAVLPRLDAGASGMAMLDILRGLEEGRRIGIVTTLPDEDPLWDEFCAVTPDIVPLAAYGPRGIDVLEHLLESRGTRLILSSDSGWLHENAAELKRRIGGLRVVDILHDALPAGHPANEAGKGEGPRPPRQE